MLYAKKSVTHSERMQGLAKFIHSTHIAVTLNPLLITFASLVQSVCVKACNLRADSLCRRSSKLPAKCGDKWSS